MEYNKSNLEEMYARLTIEVEEEGGMVVDAVEIHEEKEQYVLVGRFLMENNINFQAMQNLLASLWRPKEGMEVHDLGGNKYSFVFYHVMDLNKVVDGGPWAFEQSTLVVKRVTKMEDPHMVPLEMMDMWVQVHDILKDFITINVLKSIGMYVGEFLKADSNSFDGGWKSFIRIKVMLNIMKPFKRRMKIKREGGSWSWINFKYERLGNFRFMRGILGHTDKECDIVYANLDKEVERAYEGWLRAKNRDVRNNVAARWLRNINCGDVMTEYGGGSCD
ncbi:uncharacterized protein LOC141719869 [Apium graveolens]|uniref:uncharacterized protein LOC141719869 n=1 Tax=Apium graveolens TaxID=4045 RepID=UPI003D793AF7